MTEGVMCPAVSVQQHNNSNSYCFFASALLTFFFCSITISDDLRDVFFIVRFFSSKLYFGNFYLSMADKMLLNLNSSTPITSAKCSSYLLNKLILGL